jgi:hypothetical protein
MTPRSFYSIVLLALIFPAQEIWQLWRESNQEVNWWVMLDYPLAITWYFKFLGIHIADILKSIVLYRITFKIQSLNKASIVVLIYNFVDLALFFVCFNKAPYALILATVGLVSLIIFNWKNLYSYFHQHKLSHT